MVEFTLPNVNDSIYAKLVFDGYWVWSVSRCDRNKSFVQVNTMLTLQAVADRYGKFIRFPTISDIVEIEDKFFNRKVYRIIDNQGRLLFDTRVTI